MIGMVMARVFVSNERDRECGDQARNERSLFHLCVTLAFAKTGLIARGISRGAHGRVPSLDQGSPESSSRLMKVPPSRDLIFFWTRLVDNSSEACWNVTQLFEFLVGTVLGSHGNYGIPNCGGGGAAARSSLDQGSPESKSLSYAVLREIVLRMDAMPWYRRQRQWKVASSDECPQNDALDHGVVSALRLVEGLLAEGCRVYPGKGMANSFRSRSSSFTRRRGAEFLGGMSGRAGIPSGREEPHPGKTVSYPSSVIYISTTITFLPCTHFTSADLFPPWRFSLSRLSSI